MDHIALVIPSIPPREAMLQRALDSVHAQTLQPAQLIVEIDRNRSGAALTRTRGLERVTCPYVAFLDDDDELLPHHLETLAAEMERTSADMVFPWFTVIGGTDPFPGHFGREWDDAKPRQTTITFMARTKLMKDIGGFLFERCRSVDADGNRFGEDFAAVCAMV